MGVWIPGCLDSQIRRAHWHSYWVGKWNEPDARTVVLKWLPPIAVNVQNAKLSRIGSALYYNFLMPLMPLMRCCM